MTFPGTAIIKVGERPLHNVKIPSFRAIFLKPSRVELKVLRCVSSAAQSEAVACAEWAAEDSRREEDDEEEEGGEATQNWD